MFLNQGTSQPEASQEQEEKVNGDMASAWEELELDDVQLATVVGGAEANASLGVLSANVETPYVSKPLICRNEYKTWDWRCSGFFKGRQRT